MSLKSIIHKPFKYSYNNFTLVIICINLVLFVLCKNLVNLQSLLSLNVLYIVKKHAYWQFFTYMFMHGSLEHILLNMLALFCFGTSVERGLGSKEFLLLYLLSGVFCGIFSFIVYYFGGINGNIMFFYVRLVGASGAIYSLLLAYAVMFPRNVIYLMGVLPVPAPILVLVYAIIALVSQIFSLGGNVAHITHLAGFIFAWFYFILRMGINPIKVWKNL